MSNNLSIYFVVVKIFPVHGALGPNFGSSNIGVRGRSSAEDHSVHAPRILAESAQQIRSTCNRRWMYMDIYAFYIKGES